MIKINIGQEVKKSQMRMGIFTILSDLKMANKIK